MDNINNNYKLYQLFGYDNFQSNPTLYTRILKKLGIYYIINKYFNKRNKKVYPFVVDKYRLRINEIQYE